MKRYRYLIIIVLLSAASILSLSAQVVEIIDVSSTPTTCSDGFDGSITFTISGGVAPYRWYIYSISGIPDDFGGPTAVTTITSTGRNKYGSYLIVVRDLNDDAGTVFISVGGPDSISIQTFSSTDITCNNANNGTISVTATGESGAHYFDLAGPVIENGNTTGNFSGLPQGDYTVTVRDQGLCTTTDMTPVLTINNPSLVTAALDNITDAACYGESSGSIAITPSGGSPSGSGTGYTYAWTGPSGFTSPLEDITNLEAGDYFVRITDGNGCFSDLGPYTVGQPTQINVVLDASTDVLCNGGSDGTASITASGGAGGYTYSWIGLVNGLVSTDEDPVNLSADTYDLVVADSDGCTRTFTSFLAITEPPLLNITLDEVNDVNCNGGSDGSVRITPGGGTPNYSFLWTGSFFGYTSTDEDPTGMPADTYSLTITDANGCSRIYTDLLSIGEPPNMTLTLVGSSNVSCFGGNDGTATITVAGGTPPYTFAWVGVVNGPASDVQDPNDLLADTYSLFVLDNNGCFVSAINFLTITEPAGLAVSVDLVTDVNCNGGSTGAIDITPLGGTAPFTFNWTGPNGFTSTDEDLTGLAAGDYSLSFSDINTCTRLYNPLASIIENPPITGTFAVTDLNCGDPVASNDGAIDASILGGVAPYTFSWTGPFGFTASTEDINALLPGPYLLEVTDLVGCTMTSVQLVGIPPVLTASTAQVDIDCFGAGNGSIDLTVSGGTAPYLFAWTGPSGFTATSEDIANLEAGAYSVTVTDDHGCPVPFADIATITEVAEILVSTVRTDVSCAGGADGTLDITVTGGIAPFTFAWTGPSGFSSTNEDLAGLSAGTYNLTITDANGCVVSFSNLETIIEPAPITVSYTQVDVITCFDSPEGSIDATAAGGTGTILYSMDGSVPGLSGIFINLTSGFHTLSLTDQNGCTKDSIVEILGPAEVLIDNIAINDVTGCAGDTTGSLVITASGGTGILEYSLDDVSYQPAFTFNLLTAGDYTVYVRDANGCTTSAPATVGEPAPLTAVVVKTDASFGSLGSITFSGATGGTSPYEYSIQGPGGPFTPTTVYTDLTPATYHVIVRDQNGCMYQELVDILDIVPLDVLVNISHVSCFGANDATIEFVPQDAVGAVQYSIDNGGTFVSTPLFENLAGSATYDLVAIDEAGKVFVSSVNINEPTAMAFSHTTTPAQCNAFSPTGAANITVTGGTGTYTYLWSDGSTDEDRILMPSGVYSVQIWDGNNCMLEEMVIISSEVVVNAYAGEDTSVCYGESLQLSGSGDYAPVWEPSALLDRNDILNPVTTGITQPTTFTLTFTETVSPYACTNTDSITVSPYPELGIDVTPDTFVISGSSAQLEASGGPFVEYRWEPETGLNNSSIPNPIATPYDPIRYYVYGISEHGCEEVDSVFIDVLEDITVYNVFSPNGDGINEYFEIEHADRFPEMLVQVYSRWGDLLFSTVGYHSGSWWDGRARGKEAPVGTYYYVVVPYPGAKPITGHVTIIR